jgi:hypothetical protein
MVEVSQKKIVTELECHSSTWSKCRSRKLSQSWNVTVEKCHMVKVSQLKFVTVEKMLGGRIVWVGMSCGRFVGGRNVKVPSQQHPFSIKGTLIEIF